MSFILLMLVFSVIAYVPQRFFGDKKDYRMALRYGMAGGFTFTGIDHFLNAETRYIPMLPDLFDIYALELVYFAGGAELLGALGLILPLAFYKQLKLPNLRKWAGIGLSIMLVFLVIANINVAMKGSSVAGLKFGAWYYWLRPFLQPVIILWALYVSGVIWKLSKKESSLKNPSRIDA